LKLDKRLVRYYLKYFKHHKPNPTRFEFNDFYKNHAIDVKGKVLHAGGGRDVDKQGDFYEFYFKNADSYKTLDIAGRRDFDCSITDMNLIEDRSFDCVFSNAVLEHIKDVDDAVSEVFRILRPGGVFLFGVPFNCPYHGHYPDDYWRFSLGCVFELIDGLFDVDTIRSIGDYSCFNLDDRLKMYSGCDNRFGCYGWAVKAIKLKRK